VEGASATNTAICEVVVSQDVRSRSGVRTDQLFHSYYLRRTLSVAFLMCLDVFALYAAVVIAPHAWAVVGVSVETPQSYEVAWAMAIVVASWR